MRVGDPTAGQTFNVYVVGPTVGSLQILQGNRQTTFEDQPFPSLVVEAVDVLGNPVNGAPITWTISQGNASSAW